MIGQTLLWLLLAVLPVTAQAQMPYQLVRGPDNPLVRDVQTPMCRELIKNLNEFRDDPPMTCRRKFDPKFTNFSLPNWKLLDEHDAIQAALALERGLAQKGPPAEVEKRFAEYREKVSKTAAAGQLKAWQATFNIVNNGEPVRVVLVSNGECGTKYDF